MLGEDLSLLKYYILLIFYHSNDHIFDNQVGLPGVSMRLAKFSIRQWIVAVIELCHVAAKVFSDSEFATRVYFLVACSAKDKVVTYNQRITKLDS